MDEPPIQGGVVILQVASRWGNWDKQARETGINSGWLGHGLIYLFIIDFIIYQSCRSKEPNKAYEAQIPK